MISLRFRGKPFNITVIQVYAPTSNAEEAEVEWFNGDLKDLLELTRKKKISFSLYGTGMGEFNSDDHYIYYYGKEALKRNGVAIIVNKSRKCGTWMQSQK